MTEDEDRALRALKDVGCIELRHYDRGFFGLVQKGLARIENRKGPGVVFKLVDGRSGL